MKIGDKVRVIDEACQGLVSKIERNTFWVDIEGMDFPYAQTNLLLVEESNDNIREAYKRHSPNNMPAKFSDKPVNAALSKKEIIEELGRVRGKRNSKGILEFDLHIHDLLAKTSHMTSGEMLHFQIDYAVHCIEAVIKKREPNFIFIHGIGKGVLRAELHQIIRSYGFSFNDGFMKEYGVGATKVELRG